MDASEHFKCLFGELDSVKNRVRNLIGLAHLGSDGAWKESVFKSVLKRHISSDLQVGSGFVVSADGQTTQVDVLIYKNTGPKLFQDGDFVILTPDSVVGIIEVKTKMYRNMYRENLEKLDKTARFLDSNHCGAAPFFGIFAYESEDFSAMEILDPLREINHGFGQYPISCLCFGGGKFVRFWPIDPQNNGQVYKSWHLYELYNNLAYGYFIHNVIEHIYPHSVLSNQELWYPSTSKELSLVAIRQRHEPV